MSHTFRSKNTERTTDEIEPATDRALDVVVAADSPIIRRKPAIPQPRDEAA